MLGTYVLSDAQAVGSGGTVYSSSMKFYKSTGFLALLVGVYGNGGNTSMTVTQQCSINDSDWYDAVNESNTAIGAVAAAFTSTNGVTTYRYIQPDPVLAPYIRYKIVEGGTGAGAITIKCIPQEELQ